MHTGVVINAEITDAERGDGVDETHRAMTDTGITEALDIVHTARAGFPVCHCSPLWFVFGKCGLDNLGRDALPVGNVDDDNVLSLRIEGIGGQFFRGGRFHANGQAIDAGECTVNEHHHLVARHDGGEHHVEPAPPGARNTKRVGVVGTHDIAQHFLALDHATEDIWMHMVCEASTGVARQDACVRVARSGACSNRVRD